MANTGTTVRIDGELLQAIDAHAAEMAAQQPGMAVSRADAVRVLIRRGLEVPRPGDGKAPRPRPMAKARRR